MVATPTVVAPAAAAEIRLVSVLFVDQVGFTLSQARQAPGPGMIG
jgi:hypothetical protein